MYELVRTTPYGVDYFRNINTNENYTRTGEFWWKDEGDGILMQVTAPDSFRIVEM